MTKLVGGFVSRSLICLRCRKPWEDFGRWPRECPWCGSAKHVVPASEAK